MKPKYTFSFLDDDFSKIETLAAVKAGYESKLVLRLDGKPIGQARLCSFRKNLHTESVALNRKFRRRGHGIYLYLALIQVARRLGARRIYSSTHLNKFSRKMWSVKLARHFKVRTINLKNKCGRCGHSSPVLRYFITL